MASPRNPDRNRAADAAQNALIRGLLWLILRVPYAARIRMMGWLAARVVAPLLGWDKRVRANLAHVCPDLPEAEVARLTRAVPNNAGRQLIELYSGPEFKARVKDTPLTGPGVAAFRAAREAGRPTVLVTAHFGNYDVARTALFAQGHPLGALYREMKNPEFNTHYVEALSVIGTPIFPATRAGITGFVDHLRKGGLIGILIDIYAGEGAKVSFFGKPAPTATSTMEWALKYDATVIPIYGRRRENGLDFDIVLDEEIPLSDAVTMTQAANDSLERMVRANMDQWFWIHRRWKPEDQARRAALAEAAS
ncbi:lysophospholipid acyltransferase family protein [Oceaniglobus roseus]|uniref:lysophospholipid acyltransferase family protein n=1 Tax=Oceaniglobus roseus TaxID=1737570 RepID=UPI000C7EA3A0|nr:lysophospholipid acyltransferase family protein [Kandeliimicrobium roseum]